jgi:hypothetical protein
VKALRKVVKRKERRMAEQYVERDDAVILPHSAI